MPKDVFMEPFSSLVAPLHSMIYESPDTISDDNCVANKSPTSLQPLTRQLRHSNSTVNRDLHGMTKLPSTFQHLASYFPDFHDSDDAVNDHSHEAIKSSISFQHLPRELRDEIYQYVIGDIHQLEIPKTGRFGTLHRDSPRHLLLRRIPRGLLLNRQILHEALEMALDHVSGIKAFSPRDTTSVYPSDKLLRNVRRLEFTFDQSFYSSSGRGTCSAPQDVASRCPQLQELKLLLPATKSTMNDFSSDLANIFENKNLVKLTLAYKNAPRNGWDTDYALFRPLESWFMDECIRRGRCINFTIDLAPGFVSCHIEDRRVRNGCIEYRHSIDIFG